MNRIGVMPSAAVLDDDRSREPLRWLLAGAIVLAAHAGIVATLLSVKSPPQGAPSVPAVLIDMTPAAAPEQTMDAAIAPEEMVAAEDAPPQPVEPPPPEATVDLIEPARPEPAPLVAMPEPPPPLPPEERKLEPEKKPPEPKPEVKRVERRPPAPQTAAPARADRQAPTRQSAQSAGASASPAALADWRSRVLSQLQRAKRYPAGAESRLEQGVATVAFTVSRNGGVTARRLAGSSGHSELDQEVVAMVSRAAPFPPFPEGMAQASINLTVPVRFSAR